MFEKLLLTTCLAHLSRTFRLRLVTIYVSNVLYCASVHAPDAVLVPRYHTARAAESPLPPVLLQHAASAGFSRVLGGTQRVQVLSTGWYLFRSKCLFIHVEYLPLAEWSSKCLYV